MGATEVAMILGDAHRRSALRFDRPSRINGSSVRRLFSLPFAIGEGEGRGGVLLGRFEVGRSLPPPYLPPRYAQGEGLIGALRVLPATCFCRSDGSRDGLRQNSSSATVLIRKRSSAARPVHFFCWPKRNEPKKRAFPDEAHLPSQYGRDVPTRQSLARSEHDAHPVRRPSGLEAWQGIFSGAIDSSRYALSVFTCSSRVHVHPRRALAHRVQQEQRNAYQPATTSPWKALHHPRA